MAALFWAEARRRWRSAALVGLVLGVGFGAVCTAAAGARRTDTAFPRMLAATDAPELLVSGAGDPASQRRFYEQIAGLDAVANTGLVAGLALVPVDVPKGAGTVLEACANASADGVAAYRVGRPNVVEGRLPRRGASGEILVSHGYAETFGVGVGDELDLVLVGDDSVPAGEATADDGPVVHTTVVGVGVLASQVVPVSDLDAAPTVLPSPALIEQHASDPERWCYDAAILDLAPDADVEAVTAAIDGLGGGDGEPFIQNLAGGYAEVRRAIRPQVTALWLFAAAAGAATLLVVAQLLGRQVRDAAADSTRVWRALGVTRSQSWGLLAAPSIVTGLVGAAAALAAAVALSGRFPIGPARVAETNRGPELHSGIHLGGALVVLIAAVAIGVAASHPVLRTPARPAHLGWIGRLGQRVSRPALAVGIHLATGSRGAGTTVPVRSAAAGAALALGAVVATVTFSAGLHDLVSEPARYGRDWDVMLDGEFGPSPIGKVLEELGDEPSVTAIAGGRYGEVTIDGQRVPTVGLTDVKGSTFPAIIDGRAPTRGDEIVMGTRSLRDLERSVGDVVTLEAGAGPREVTIVGTAAFPRINRGSFSVLGLGVGAMARTDVFPAYELPEAPPGIEPADWFGPGGSVFEFVTIRLRRDATDDDRRHVIETATGIGTGTFQTVRTEQRPVAIDNYAAIRSTPVVLAVVLGSMAAATLAHLVVSVVRRRRRDLALCAALGMRRVQVLSAVVVQALLVAGAALLVGVPLGLAAGRLAWRGFASELGVVDAFRLPLGTVALVAVVVGLVAMAVAAVPAFVASRLHPALVLRAE
jgi:FtsX-like permease family